MSKDKLVKMCFDGILFTYQRIFKACAIFIA